MITVTDDMARVAIDAAMRVYPSTIITLEAMRWALQAALHSEKLNDEVQSAVDAFNRKNELGKVTADFEIVRQVRFHSAKLGNSGTRCDLVGLQGSDEETQSARNIIAAMQRRLDEYKP